MSTFSSLKLNKNMNMNDNAKKPSHAHPEVRSVEQIKIESFGNSRADRQAEEKQYLEDKFNSTITQREQAMEEFKAKVNEDVQKQRDEL